MDWEGFFARYREPDFVPGFQIVNKLGSGVFGEVYKAQKTSIGKFYAIKFLKVSDEKIGEAIIKELDSLRYFAQLDHPNLVTIEDKGEVMGIPFIVMGYAGDETMKRRLADGGLDASIAREIFVQVCAGVAALHEKSIIHFDLKPANIFMKGNHARVGDYGLSKLVSESHKSMSIGRGTPYYMAPEMLRRKGDNRSDIYSLGIILYEMLTGEVPFNGDSEWEVLKKHETEDAHIPDVVLAPYRSVIQRALQKDPLARFASVRDMMAALDVDEQSVRTSGSRAAIASSASPSPAGPQVRVVPPPLPEWQSGTKTARNIRRHMSEIIAVVQRDGGEQAESARKAWAVWTSQGGDQARGFNSFYQDFDDQAERAPANKVGAVLTEAAVNADRAMRTAARKATGKDGHSAEGTSPSNVPAKDSSGVLWPLQILMLPFVAVFWLLKVVFLVTKNVYLLIGSAIGAFLRNFVRYTIVLATTAGLAFLIHQALRGFPDL